MSTSQNGWPVIESGVSDLLVSVPKIVGKIRAGNVATIAAYVIERFDQLVEDVDAGRDDWGWAARLIRGSTTVSNHASGTAWDLNATRHVLGKRGTFTPAQVEQIHAIVADLDGVVRWGGDYSGRPDEMHWEVVGTPAQAAEVAERIRAGLIGAAPTTAPADTTADVPVPSAPAFGLDTTWQEIDDMDKLIIALYGVYLGRVPSQAEVNGWLETVARNAWTAQQLRDVFVQSRAEAGTVTQAYLAHLGRVPESADVVRGWSDGESIAQVWAGVSGSPEARARR